jgi:hypothetical protein
MNRWRSRVIKKARGSALKRLPFWRRATRTGDPLESSLWLLGLVDLEPRAAQKGCRSRLGFLDTPGDSSYIVLGRYFGTVVAWARHLDLKKNSTLSRRLATVRMFAQQAKLLHG